MGSATAAPFLETRCRYLFTRPSDIVARFDAEEFIVLMPQTILAQALLKAEQFRSALETRLMEPMTRPVTCSSGVAELAPEEDGQSLLSRVDGASYQAKERGRNRVVAAGSDECPASRAGQSVDPVDAALIRVQGVDRIR